MSKNNEITSSHEMQLLGEKFATNFKNGGIVLLYGNLGAGKTTFVQGFAKGLGISKRIISPTFTIIRSHKLENDKFFYHIDLYRTNGDEEEVKEILSDPTNIVAIEWAEKLPHLSVPHYQIHFTIPSDTSRQVIIEKID